MLRTVTAVLLATILSIGLSWAAHGAGGTWVGYRGPNGTGIFPESRPPVDCDMATGRNILWRTPLPNWGHGCPMIVKGRAFVLSEPGWKSDWPVLTCIDTVTGRALWEREVNHLPATGLPPAKQVEIASQWHDFHALWRDLYQTFNVSVVQQETEKAAAQFEALGYVFGGHHGGGYGQLRSLKPKPGSGDGARRFAIAAAGLHGETWHHGCGLGTDCIGMAFATPVSDGTNVYVTTTFSGAACYDLDGNLRWIRFVAPQSSESYARSPLLYGDLLISDYFGKTVAFDKRTGEIRWVAETQGGSIATPAVITVGGTDILLTEGGQGSGLHALRLPDGKELPVEGWNIGGTQILADTDRRDVAYFCGRGQHSFWPERLEVPKPPAAVRFALDGDVLRATLLWDGTDFLGAGRYVGMLYHDGKLYCCSDMEGVVIDAATGKLVAGSMDRRLGVNQRVLPATHHLLLLAGNRFYGLAGQDGIADRPPDPNKPAAVLSCYSLDGKLLGQSTLERAPVTDDKLAQIRSQVGWDAWSFSYSMPFTIAGNDLYVRSEDELICIGTRDSAEVK